MLANKKMLILSSLPLLALLLLALWSLLVQRLELDAAPSEEEWEAAREIVRQGYRRGDVVRTSPFWAEQARIGLFEIEFNFTKAPEEQELFRYERLWIISDKQNSSRAIRELPEGYQVSNQWWPSERTTVILVDIPEPEHVLYDLVSRLPEATVWRDHGSRREACDVFHQEGWHCGSINPWLHVSRTLLEVGGNLRHCVFVGIQPEGETRIEWNDLELGRRIDGNIGNTMSAIRAERGSDIRFRVEIDGQPRVQMSWGKWDRRFFPIDVDTSELEGGRHQIAFVISAEDFYDRWVCFRSRVIR